MAIVLAGIGVQAAGLTFAGGGFFAALAGGALTAGAGILDSQFLIPGLLGGANKPLGAKPPLLLQLPTFTSNPGSPRVWSYGQRVRIPCHLMFMSEKERIERTQSGAAKGGAQARVNVRNVYSDVAIALNDKKTNQIATLLGDGRLFYWTDRNLLSVRTSAMSTTVRNTNFVLLKMGNANEVDLSNRFAGRVRYEGVVATATNNGPSYSSGGEATMTVSPSPGWTTNQWVNKVFVVTSGAREGQRGYIESNTADTLVVQYRRVLNASATIEAGLTVQPQVNDTFVIAEAGDTLILAGWNPVACNGFYRILYARPHRLVGTSEALLELITPGATATAGTSGSAFTPGSVTRFDNGVAGQRLYSYENRSSTEIFITREDASASDFAPKIVTGMNITMRSSRFTGGTATGRVDRVGPGQIKVVAMSSLPSPTPSPTINIFDNLIVEPTAGTNSVPGLYSAVQFYDGSQTASSSIIAQHLTASDIPQYRGVSYIIFDDFSLTEFGNRMPNMEAVIDPDLFGTWRDAFAQVCDRVGLPAAERALGQIDTAPFDGMYIRGTIPGISALQPLLVAKQVVTQDRDGVLHFFPISACEVVQIRNGGDFSDMGAATERDAKRPKFSMAQVERTVLPSSVGVKHQDPDNFYSEGYQHFGIRGPSGAGHETRDEVDLNNLVLNRQAARNLAGTLLRRTWINSTTYELELPASYWHVLENDVLTWTDDESIVHAARVIKIDRGQNWIVKATCVAEDVAGSYAGSPVQSGAGINFGLDGPSVDVQPLVLDIPAVFDIETRAPGLYLGVGGPANTDFLGCTIYESLDSGTTYNPIGSLSQQTISGTTVDALDAYTSQSWTAGSATVTWDNISTVQVELYNGTLSTVTQSQVLGGENWALIGNEIVGFTTATLDSPGVYTLSGFLRNLRDQVAEPDIDADQHVAGERFVLLTRFESNGKFRTYPGPANVGQSIRFKFVAPGQNIIDVPHTAVTLQARNAKPFAPYASTLTWEPNDDATITMTPWTNRNVAIGSVGPYTFDDTIEEYVVRIFTDNTYVTETASSPYTVTTRLTGAARLRDRWVTYPKASVIADGFTPGSSTIYYTIEQVGDYGTSRRKRFQG